MGNYNDGKHEIRIYEKIYRLPTLSGERFDQLQNLIRQRNENLTKGKLIVENSNQQGIFNKKLVKSKTYEPLSCEEHYWELSAIIQTYDQMMLLLTYNHHEYQKFFQELAKDIKKIIGKNCNKIAEKEQKRLLKEQEERQKSNPNPQILEMSINIESQLFEIAKSTGYAAVLMLKKLYLMSESLQRLAREQDSQKQILSETIEDIKSQKDWYELQIEINTLKTNNAKFVDTIPNFEEYMKPFMASFQDLLSSVSTVDKALFRRMDEIQSIAKLLEFQQFSSIEFDVESQRIADFLATDELKKDRYKLDQKSRSNTELDSQIRRTGRGVTIAGYLRNICDFLDLRLDKFRRMNIPAIAINEPNLDDMYSFGDVLTLNLDNSVMLELVRVNAGQFMMGSPNAEDNEDESPQHQVILKKFLIGKYAVTNAQWQAVMKTKGSVNCDKKFQGDLQPVVGVSWQEAREFCTRLSQQTGKNVRLPTEAEWEYAARGASKSKGLIYSGSNNLDEVAWYRDNSGSVTHPVGQKIANEIGVYDMSGNTWEWCLDEWHDSYENKSEELANDGNKPWIDLDDNNENRSCLLRGGSCNNIASKCRSANRSWHFAHGKYINVGFRILVVSSS